MNCFSLVGHLCLKGMCLSVSSVFPEVFSQIFQMPDYLTSRSMQKTFCGNHRCHEQGQTDSQYLSVCMSVSVRHTPPMWHKMICHSDRATAGTHLSTLASSKILSLLLAGRKLTHTHKVQIESRRKHG